MSDSSRRKVDIDYWEYNKSGKKVPKYRGSKMDADLAKQDVIYSDVEDFFESYDLETMSSCDDLEKYVEKIGELKQEFRRVHYHLRLADLENFETTYPKYPGTLQKLSNHFKRANVKVSTLKNAEKHKRDEIEKLQGPP